MPKGTIKRLVEDRGFGFIRIGERKDLFFHSSDLQSVEFANLRQGQEVEFEIRQEPDGRNKAVKVRLVQAKGS